MKLSQLTEQDKIKLAAELDEDKPTLIFDYTGNFTLDYFVTGEQFMRRKGRYDQSYDSIIPLIQRQSMEVKSKISVMLGLKHDWCAWLSKSPSQLLDALLVATGKAEL